MADPGKGNFCNLQIRISSGTLRVKSASLIFNNGQRFALAPNFLISPSDQAGGTSLLAPRKVSGVDLVISREVPPPASAHISLWGDTSTFGQAVCSLAVTQ